VKEIETMTFEEIGKLVRAKEAERRAKLSPEERAEEDRRREERRRREEEEYLAKKDETVPLLEYERDIRDLEALLDLIQGEADERLENLADMTLDKLQAQEAELKAARARIDALLDANLKAQDMRRQLDQLTAQGDRIEKKGDRIEKKVGEIDKHNQHAEAYLGIMPDHEELGEIRKAVRKHLDEKKKSRISNETAARIFKTFYPDPRGIYKKLTGHTIGDWLEAGMMKKTNFKIDETALASKMSFLQWIISNCHEVGIEVKLPKAANEILNDL